MKGRTIERMHRILGLGMDARAVDELVGDHLESVERRNGLSATGHAGFMFNNLVRRLVTPASSDMGAHLLPALVVTGVGIAVYVLGGKGATPGSTPAWPMIPLAIGVLWLIVQTSRASGFPLRRGVLPALVAGFGALADAWVMPVSFPEERFIQAGLVVLGAAGPAVFILLALRRVRLVSWSGVRAALAAEWKLRAAWRLLSVGLALIAFGEVFAWSRFKLPNSVQAGAVLMGLGLAWMARSFYIAGQASAAGSSHGGDDV